MNIFIDESGSFVSASKRDSWNCVAAYLSPEVDRKYMRAALARLRGRAGASAKSEVKLRELQEDSYFDFLRELDGLQGVLFAVATDAGLNTVDELEKHRNGQAEKIVEHKDKMKYEIARQGLEDFAARVRALSPQLYVQLFCQVLLIESILMDAVLYFVQRIPVTLGSFRWRIDQKNTSRTKYEEAFTTMAPPLLQTMSLRTPMPMLIGADYRHFKRFDYPKGQEPTYLKDTYGIDLQGDGPKLNVGMVMHEDLRFEDSNTNQGVQVADLLAAGMRRCLRRQFADNERAAELLGALMVQAPKKRPPVRLVGFTLTGDEEGEPVGSDVARLIRTMKAGARSMLASPSRTRARASKG